MKITKILSGLLQRKVKLKDIWYYIQGNIRYRIYYSPSSKLLLRKYIREQIDFRILYMNPVCYNNGECVKCGCATTKLQMANKKCDGNCYPPMLSRKEWYRFNIRKMVVDDTGIWMIVYSLPSGEYKLVYEKYKYVQSSNSRTT